MKKGLLLFFSLCLTICVHGQTTGKLFAVGSAVGDSIVELTAFPNNQFKFAGTLREGQLRIRDTEQHKSSSNYLKPKYEDSYVINNGLGYSTSRDSSVFWVVPFTEDRYRFTVNVSAKTLKGELFTPWNELFLVGGATEIGWESYIMLPLTRDEDELCTYTWTGELKNHPQYGEPRRFKILGQNAWDPKALHPFTADEDVLKSQYLLTNGSGDNKWQITKDGIYSLRVDVFRETIQAQYLGQSVGDTPSAITDVRQTATDGIRYNLAGQRVDEHYKGIVLINGRKMVSR